MKERKQKEKTAGNPQMVMKNKQRRENCMCHQQGRPRLCRTCGRAGTCKKEEVVTEFRLHIYLSHSTALRLRWLTVETETNRLSIYWTEVFLFATHSDFMWGTLVPVGVESVRNSLTTACVLFTKHTSVRNVQFLHFHMWNANFFMCTLYYWIPALNEAIFHNIMCLLVKSFRKLILSC